MPPELHELLNEIGTSFEEFKAQQSQRMNEIEKRMNRPGFGFGGTGHEASAALIEQKAALANFMRTGANEHKSSSGMMVGSDPSGGYVVSPEFSAEMTKTIFLTSQVRQAGARVVSMSKHDAFEEIIDKDEVGAPVWASETSAPVATNAPDLQKLRIPTFEMRIEPKVTAQLLEDADIDVAAWLIEKIGDRMGRAENQAFLVGTGQDQPKGLTSYPTSATADATRAWGTFEHLATGVAGDFAASNPADILFDVVNAMKPPYRQGAVWIMPRAVATKIRKFKENTTQAYIWAPGLVSGQPATLLGYPVIEMEDMPALASGSLSVAFVNLQRAYTIVDRVGVQLLRDPFTSRPWTVFATRRRVGGGATQFEAAKLIKFS